MFIEIGSKPLKELTVENVIDIVKIIGAMPCLEYWHEPTVIEFDNTMFSDTIVVYYKSYRISDNKESQEYMFFLDFKRFHWHYSKDYERVNKLQRHHSREFSLEVLRYLIKQGFDVPLY